MVIYQGNEYNHYNNVIMSAMASQITSRTIVYSTVYSRRRPKKTSKLRVTGLCEGNLPAQRASNAENVSIWWRHHGSSSLPDYWCSTPSVAQKAPVHQKGPCQPDGTVMATLLRHGLSGKEIRNAKSAIRTHVVIKYTIRTTHSTCNCFMT